MSLPQSPPTASNQDAPRRGPDLLRSSIWVAIGALIAAAIVCVLWVLVGPENDLIGRAFLTILLLSGFAGVAILDAHLAPRRAPWFALTSMVVWVVILIVGAFLIWMPTRDDYGLNGFTRFMSFLLIVIVLQLALLHLRLYLKAHVRYVTAFTRAITWVTVALVAILAIMLVLPLTLHEFIDFRDLYWRFVVAITILAAVGTALIPLVNVLFAPKKPAPIAAGAGGYAAQPWPTYVDGVTPLPVLPDGSPDWNAYDTGYPTYSAPSAADWSQHPAPAAPSPGAQPAPVQPAAPQAAAPPHSAVSSQPVAPAQPAVPEQSVASAQHVSPEKPAVSEQPVAPAPGPAVPPPAPAVPEQPAAPPPGPASPAPGHQGYPPPPPPPR